MKILVTGGTGFIGSALRPALLAQGHVVRALTRTLAKAPSSFPGETWVEADLGNPGTLEAVLKGMDMAFYLVHSVGSGEGYAAVERQHAASFAEAAARAGLEKIVYLGGVVPETAPSEHLLSRKETGETLRRGRVPTLELRASMVIGNGSASWQIVRDLSLRLPVMILPAWLESKTRPIDIDDVIHALVRSVDFKLTESRWFDLPGPEVVTGRQILLRVAKQRGRWVPMVRVPVLSPTLSAYWLRLITRAPYGLSKELVLGLAQDLLPRDEGFWKAIHEKPKVSFDMAVKKALMSESSALGWRGAIASLEEGLVDAIGSRLRTLWASNRLSKIARSVR